MEAGLIATPLIVKLPDGFTEAFIAEPVACCSTNEGNDPTGMGGGAEKFDMLNRDMFVANGWPEKVALPLGVDGRPMLDDDMLESVAFEASGWPVG